MKSRRARINEYMIRHFLELVIERKEEATSLSLKASRQDRIPSMEKKSLRFEDIVDENSEDDSDYLVEVDVDPDKLTINDKIKFNNKNSTKGSIWLD